MPSAFKRRLPPQRAVVGSEAQTSQAGLARAGDAEAPSASSSRVANDIDHPVTAATPVQHIRRSASLNSGHAILDRYTSQTGSLTQWIPSIDLAHPRPLHNLPQETVDEQVTSANDAYAHAEQFARLSAAQGIKEGAVLVVGPEARQWAERIPKDLAIVAQSKGVTGTSTPKAAPSGRPSSQATAHRDLGSASRYAGIAPKPTTEGVPGMSSDTSPAGASFDLTKVLEAEGVERLESEGVSRLTLLDLSVDTAKGGDEPVAQDIQTAETRALALLQPAIEDHHLPLRVFLLGLGSRPWSASPLAMFQLMLAIRRLAASSRLRPVHCTALLSVASLQSQEMTSGWLSRIISLSNISFCISSFHTSSQLLQAFPAHTGAIRVSSASPCNAFTSSYEMPDELGYRARKRGLGIGLLHLDVGGGVGERRTKAPVGSREPRQEGGATPAKKQGSATLARPTAGVSDIEDAHRGLHRPAVLHSTLPRHETQLPSLGPQMVRGQASTTSGQPYSDESSRQTLPVAEPDSQTRSGSSEPTLTSQQPKKLTGIAALRARGLASHAKRGGATPSERQDVPTVRSGDDGVSGRASTIEQEQWNG